MHEQHYTHTLGVAGRRMPGTIPPFPCKLSNPECLVLPSPWHITSAQHRARLLQEWDKGLMLHSGFHGNRGGVERPEMLQTPLLLTAAQSTVLQKALLFAGGAEGAGRCLYLAGCRVPQTKRNGNLSSPCSCKGKGNVPRRPRFLRVKCVCSLKGSGWLLIRT